MHILPRKSYRDLVFLPLDLPKFPFADRVLLDFEPNLEEYTWKEEVLTQPIRFHGEKSDWIREKREKYAYMLDWVERHIPIVQFSQAMLMRAIADSLPHYDIESENWDVHHLHHLNDHEPSGYRLLIRGSRDCLFFTERNVPPDDLQHGLKKTFCRLPESTDAWAFCTTNVPHGIDKKEDDRLLLNLEGKLDTRRHRELIERSYEKYKNDAILMSEVYGTPPGDA